MLINLRNALMAGKRLPYDAEVEFLESTGTQWIDTGVNGAADLYYSLTIQPTYSSGDRKYFGSYPSGLTLAQLNGNWRFLERNWILSSVAVDSTTASVVERRSDGLYVNGAKVADIWDGARASTGLILFGQRTDSGVSLSYCRVYACKIYLGAVLVRDFIPVRKGTVGYLYDRVSGKLFGNAGTGDFVLGPDVVPVEYLQADGNSKLYSPISLNSSNLAAGVEIRMDAAIPNPGNVNGILCQAGGYYVSPWAIATKSNSPGTCLLYSYGKFSREFTGLSNRTTMVVEVDATTVYLTVGSTRSGGTYNTTYQYGNQLVIFGYDGTGSGGSTLPAPAGTRLYAYKIYVRNVLVADAIPIRVGTDATSWEGAMMDVLTRRIYRNAGTGAFSYGNDLKYPIPAA